MTARGEDVARAYNRLGFALLSQCRQSLAKTNYFLSPPGLAFTLSMVETGAKGETSRLIQTLLGAEDMAPEALNALNKDLLARMLELDPKIKLEIANSLWVDKSAALKADFIADDKDAYDAEVCNVDLKNPATVGQINEWVSARTHGKIARIVEAPLDPLLRVILLNAIYFKGDWTTPFATNLTRDLPFTLMSGQTVLHPRMSETGSFRNFEDETLQAVELPYSDGSVSMFIVLPKGPLDGLLSGLTLQKFERWTTQMPLRKGTLQLPKFRLSNEYNLREVLSAMGISPAFTPMADFSGMSAEPLFIGWVKQKTYVEVNEQGTEAAAVTGVGVRAMAIRKEPRPFEMIVDHPFLIAIREKKTGLLLFLGAIFDPR